MKTRTQLVYGALLVVWAMILVWQVVEHTRVRRVEDEGLINSAKYISTTLGVVMRSQRRFGVIPMDRMETALKALIKPGELNAIALLNSAGEVVASAGTPIEFDTSSLIRTGEHWDRRSVALMNLVDLGTNVASEVEGSRSTIIVRTPERDANRPPPPPRPPDSETDGGRFANRPEPGPQVTEVVSNGVAVLTNATENVDPLPRRRGWNRHGRPPFGRPFWMSEEEYQKAIEKQGVHSFVVVFSTAKKREALGRDLWLRLIIGGLASVSVVGLGLAWSNLNRSSDLELRLVRTAELNTRLKEMNFAAAGLAHETKNPLNIIRGLAQIISKQEDAPPEVRSKSHSIVDEADRVTAQLNEFINYSRPREVRRSAVALNSVVSEVVRALNYDVEEKAIQLRLQDNLPLIKADEQLLRQALFNLLLNAVQAVGKQGEIQVLAEKGEAGEVVLEIRDNGPGVPAEHRSDIFKPYFTTNLKGTGLGLAVVQQIVLAHGWEIQCLAE